MKPYTNLHLLTKAILVSMAGTFYSCTFSPSDPHAHKYGKTEENQEVDGHKAEVTTVHLNKEQLERAKIKVAKAELRSIGSEIKVNGMIDVPPQNHVSINMPYGGFLKEITVLPGSHVKKGQRLATVNNPAFIQFQQDYLEALGKQELLKTEFERQTTLHAEEVSSTKVLQQAKSDYLINEATIKSNEERLRLIGFNPEKVKAGHISSSVSLYSPVNGSVREVLTNVGKYTNPQDVIMNLTNTDDLHVELTVYENDVDKVYIGQTILFSVANSMENKRKAEVFLVGSDVREDRSITVHGHLKGKETDLLPGMYVTALLKAEGQQVLSLPDEAFVRHEGKVFVFELVEEGADEETFKMIQVKEGDSAQGFTELKLNEEKAAGKYATQGTFYLLSALKNTGEGGHGH